MIEFVVAILHEDDDYLWESPLLPPRLEHSVCRGMDSSIFFPKRGESTKAARYLCSICKDENDCAEYAIVNGLAHGIWGGTSPRERAKIRQDRGLTRQIDG